MATEFNVPKVAAPSVQTPLSPNLSSSSTGQPNALFVSNDGFSAPKLSAPSVSLSPAPSVGGIASSAASSVGINTGILTTQTSSALGTSISFTSTIGSNVASQFSLSSMKLPGQIPGLDKAGILLGAGPKFIADTIVKYQTIVPPFAPDLKINMAMVGAAISIAKSSASGNVGDIAESLLEDLKESAAGTLQDQIQSQIDAAKDVSGTNALESGFNNLQSQANITTGNVQDAINNTPPQVNLTAGGASDQGTVQASNGMGTNPPNI